MGMHIWFIEARDKIPAPPEGFKLCGQHAPYTSMRAVPQGAGSDGDKGQSRRRGEEGSSRSVVSALATLLFFSLLANVTMGVRSKAFESLVRRIMAWRGRTSNATTATIAGQERAVEASIGLPPVAPGEEMSPSHISIRAI